MMKLQTERRLLQTVVALTCVVPISVGLYGIAGGFTDRETTEFVNHVRYLSGLLLGIGLYFLISLPRIEILTKPYRLLTGIIFIGGLSRVLGIFLGDAVSIGTLAPLAVELILCSLICLWQNSYARRSCNK